MPPLFLCEQLLDAQARFGPHGRDARAAGSVAFGRCLYRLLPEDELDRQPLAADGLLLVADLRIDNRAELAAELGLRVDDGLADSALLLRGWQRWRLKLLDRLLGDFAFAVWEEAEERLILARDPLGERPLHYCETEGIFAFASMSGPLASLPAMPGGVEPDALADFVGDLPRRGPLSYHRGVRRLEPGHVLIADRSGVRSERWWDPRGPEIRLPDLDQYGLALREQIDAAVGRRLRRAAGAVGSHLSGGMDSGAVASAAALLLGGRGERLQAFTSGPRTGFTGPAPTGYVADESDAAAAIASLYPNIDHHMVRPAPRLSPLPRLSIDHPISGQPVGHVMNNLRWAAVAEQARDRGVSVLLTGEAGNFTLSAGLALDSLPDLLRLGRYGRWLGEARALAASGYRWRSILNASFGPALPASAYVFLRRALGSYVHAGEDLRLVAPGRRPGVEARAAKGGWEVAPAADSRERRWRMLQLVDPGAFRKRSLALWGIEERDPTADAQLVRFCFSLPPEALLSDGVRRPALRAALRGRLPQALIDRPVRGFQSADWHERVDGASLAAFVAPFREDAADFVDFDALDAAIRAWPTEGFAQRELIYFYGSRCLRAASAAQFAAAAHTSS